MSNSQQPAIISQHRMVAPDLSELAVDCWWLIVGHCRRAKNRVHKCHSRAFCGQMIFGAAAL
jgi:hypothetical protein